VVSFPRRRCRRAMSYESLSEYARQISAELSSGAEDLYFFGPKRIGARATCPGGVFPRTMASIAAQGDAPRWLA
jgi:hypothetical protein